MDKHRLSKFLSLVLRHNPDKLGIVLDKNGWTPVSTLISKLKTNGYPTINIDVLTELVETNDKKRFAFDTHKNRIRASQGHSIEVDLNLQELEPPEYLWHGTIWKNWELIKKSGIKKMSRQHVHLSENEKTAEKVGERRGNPVLLIIASGKMFNAGYKFYKSANNVWLTDEVPYEYIEGLK